MTNEKLKQLLVDANRRYEAMTPEQQAEMWKKQREGYAKAEASWPKPIFEYIDGVRVYASYEDYCND